MYFFNNRNKRVSRKLSLVERGHIVFSEVFSTFYNQMVIEGEGEVDLNRLEFAVKKASDSNPGSRLTLSGMLIFCKLKDSGIPPPLRVIDDHSWDGLSSEGAWFLDDTLSYKMGPTCEVVVLKGNPYRIIFRSHHMVMDGRGTKIWAEDIFKIYRGEEPVSCFSNFTEYELSQKMNIDFREPFPRDNIAPTGKTDGRISFKSRWIRKKIIGKYSNLIGQVSVLLANEARKHSPDGNFWVGLPVDLRHRRGEFLPIGNFANIIYVEVKPQENPARISENIKKQINELNDLKFDRVDTYSPYIPLLILKKVFINLMKKRHSTSQYGFSAVVSNIGIVDLDEISVENFSAKTCFFIPPGGYSPVFVTLIGSNNAVEIILSAPEVLASNGRVEKLMDRITENVIPK